MHTASSGLIPVLASLPLKKSLTIYLIFGIREDPPTKTISSILVFFKPESSKAAYNGPIVFLNRSLLSSSKRARVRVSLKSYPSYKSSISILTSWVLDRARLAISISLFNFYMALLSFEIS